MSMYAVSDTQLNAIAQAIQLKTDNPAPMTVADMPLRIGLIPSGELPVGVNAIDTGLIAQAGDQLDNIIINHNLGVAPKVTILYDIGYNSSVSAYDNGNVLYAFAVNNDPSVNWIRSGIVGCGRLSDGAYIPYTSSSGYILGFNRQKPTDSSVVFAVGRDSTAGYGLKDGHTYRWIFIT